MNHPIVGDVLRLVHGVAPSEFDHVVDTFARLEDQLRPFPADTIRLDLTVKERGTPSQRTTLEAWTPGRPVLVANSTEVDFDQALEEVRDAMTRQLSDAHSKAESRHEVGRHIASLPNSPLWPER